MKKIMLFVSVFAAALLFVGCTTVEVVQDPNLNGEKISNSGTTVAHIDVQNWGIYLFSIPLLTGTTDPIGNIAIFKDTVNVESVLPVLTKKSAELKATQTLDIASQFSVGGVIFYTRSINMSGNAVR